MIVAKTPLRISFFGGGSDIPAFYEKRGGAVLSTSIDKYMHTIINPTPNQHLKLTYSKVEIVEDAKNLDHELAREILKHFKIKSHMEIGSFADIPTVGTGLGSSSTYAVGLINALATYKNISLTRFDIAELACQMEIEKCKSPIGKQDQYAATFGGLNIIEFNRDRVTVKPLCIPNSTIRGLNDNLVMYYTGRTRKANDILSVQTKNISEEKYIDLMDSMIDQVYAARNMLYDGSIDYFGAFLDEAWHKKKELSSGISDPELDDIYDFAKSYGVTGGKILGAGGGGYFLFYCQKQNQKQLKLKMEERGLKEFRFKFVDKGTEIVYNSTGLRS